MKRIAKLHALALVPAALVLFLAGTAQAVDSCREWRAEHRRWKAEAVKRYLSGESQRAVDEAVFEVLQREAYLTSCDVRVQGARNELVGWRLVGRSPNEYGSAVLESVLERAGFDLDLRSRFEMAPVAANPSTRSTAFRSRGAR